MCHVWLYAKRALSGASAVASGVAAQAMNRAKRYVSTHPRGVYRVQKMLGGGGGGDGAAVPGSRGGARAVHGGGPGHAPRLCGAVTARGLPGLSERP